MKLFSAIRGPRLGTKLMLLGLTLLIVPLFGYHLELFGCYLAIWRYLKQIRGRMERGGERMELVAKFPVRFE